jgi:hypothetical protein
LPINQNRIGSGTAGIRLRNFKNRLIMDFRIKPRGFSFLNSLFSGKIINLGGPPPGFELITNRETLTRLVGQVRYYTLFFRDYGRAVISSLHEHNQNK